MKAHFALAVAVFFSANVAQAEEPAFDPAKVDLVDAISCKLAARDYNGFAMSISGEDGIARIRSWTRLKSGPFMNEYRLPAPIIVAGMPTDHIGFGGSGVVAILDLAVPTALGVAQKIENQAGPAAVAALATAMNLSPAQIKALPDNKTFLGERVVSETSEYDPVIDMTIRTRAAQSLKTATTHPGKSLYGCSYRMDVTPGKS